MSEPKLISPLLNNHIMGEPISDHFGVRCCPALHSETDHKFIIKIISMPASARQLAALVLSGAYPSREEALLYFRRLADEVIAEAKLLQHLSELEGFCGYDSWQLVPMDDGNGYDLYLKAPYGDTLERRMRRGQLSQLEAVNLGLDLCAALSVARRNGYMYIDLKPENIMASDERGYQIGDLGFVALRSIKYASFPDKYRSVYTAPEIVDAYSSLNETLDVYAAGLILYQVFNGNQLPNSNPLTPPEFADAEMSEIILKACDPNPELRWQNPQELAQALIAYRQNMELLAQAAQDADTSEIEDEEIICEDSTESDTPSTEQTSQDSASAEQQEVVEQIVIDGFLFDDEPVSEEALNSLPEGALTEEVNAMLAHADDLIAHPLPDPVVAPEPIEVSIPVTVPDEPAQEQVSETLSIPDSPEPTEKPAEEATPAEKAKEEEPVTPMPLRDRKSSRPRKKIKWGLLIAILLIGIVISAAVLTGRHYYENEYLQNIQKITLDGANDSLTVHLDTKIDNSLLTVYCTDTYGNRLPSPVVNNEATFASLSAGISYTIHVEIDGFHQLTGQTTAQYTTVARTTIVGFTAIAGEAEGSVILNFSVLGPDSDSWRVKYSAPGIPAKIADCNGHMAILTGLVPGNTYTFQLLPGDESLYVYSGDLLTMDVTPLIYAQNITIHGFVDGKLMASWGIQDGLTVDQWTVRCFNNTGFDASYTVADSSIAIAGLDVSQSYTLEIKANGMTVSKYATISANSITFREMQFDNSDPSKLIVTWPYEGTMPSGGWQLRYTIDGGDPAIVTCQENSYTIMYPIPGALYQFDFVLPSDITVLGGSGEYAVSEANKLYQNDFMSAADMTIELIHKPALESWLPENLLPSDRTNQFTTEDTPLLLLSLEADPSVWEELITVSVIIRDESGKYIASLHAQRNWSELWTQQFCVLSLPDLQDLCGNFTVQILFNYEAVTASEYPFSITLPTPEATTP